MDEKQATLIITGLNMEPDHKTVMEPLEENVAKINWKIENFLKIQMDQGLIDKQKFNYEAGVGTTFQTNWEIGLRYDYEYKNIAAFFKLVDMKIPGSIISVKIQLDLKNTKGNSAVTKNHEKKELKQGNEIVFKNFLGYQLPEDGWKIYLDKKKTMTFEIKITTLETKVNVGDQENGDFQKTFLTKTQSNYAFLLDDASSSDITLVSRDGKEFHAHSVILKAQWPAFPSLLWSHTKLSEKSNGLIELDVSEKTLKILLRYFYTGELLQNWADSDFIHEFVAAVGKFELTEILEMLDEVIGKNDQINYNIPLLLMVKNWNLKKAESQIVQRIAQLSMSAKTSEDLLKIYGNSY